MDLTTFTLLIVTVCAVYYYFKKKLSYFEERGIPYAPGWPIFGNLAGAIFRRQHFSDMMLDIYNLNHDAKYVGAFDFSRPVILLRDLELIKMIAIKHFDSFQNRFIVFDEKLDPLFGGNLFSMSGERWREARNLLSPAFTSSKMKAMFGLMIECCENFVNYMAELPDVNRKDMQTKELFTKYTNDVIATCAFGISVNSLKNPKNDFYIYGKKSTTFEGWAMLRFFLARLSPRLMKLLNIRFISEETAKFFKNIVADTVRTRDEKGINRPDMIQLMMNARDTEKKHLKLDIDEMTAQAFVFFLGGFDTTSTQMCLIAHELAVNPEIQNRLIDEIDKEMEESHGNPSYEAIQRMAYLDAVFNESLRRHMQFIALDRVCQKSFELPPALPGRKPFTLEPGMGIWIPAMAIHMDPKYYENPEIFDPERYYEKKLTINDELNLGFGIGPRGCIGNRFAILETKVLLVYLLSKFKFVANEKTRTPLKYSKASFNMQPEGGFSLTIERRS